jgi:hypothetical protein
MAIIIAALTAAAQWLPAIASLKRAGTIALLVAAVAVGAWSVWQLRHLSEDARIQDAANAIVERRTLTAKVAAMGVLAARQAKSADVAAKAAAEWADKLVASEAARVELEQRLKGRLAKTVCFPAGMVEALNR